MPFNSTLSWGYSIKFFVTLFVSIYSFSSCRKEITHTVGATETEYIEPGGNNGGGGNVGKQWVNILVPTWAL